MGKACDRPSACIIVALVTVLLLLPSGSALLAPRALQPVPDAGGVVLLLPSLLEGRVNHSVVELQNGTVLVFGGRDSGAPLASTELLEVDGTTWLPGPPLQQARQRAAATLLQNGTVVVCGGTLANGSATDTVEALVGGAWVSWPTLPQPRTGGVAVTLSNGSVALVGGVGGTLASPQPLNGSTMIGDLSTGQWSVVVIGTTPGADVARADIVQLDLNGTPLPARAGAVLLGGTRGAAPFGDPSGNGVRVRPDQDPIATLGMPAPRRAAVAVGLPSRTLLIGGEDVAGATDSVWSLPNDGGAWGVLPPLPVPRTEMGGAMLDSTHVLVVGGRTAAGTVVASGWVVDALNGTVVDGPSLPQPQARAAVLLLANASTLLVGGIAVGGGVSDGVFAIDPSWHLPLLQVDVGAAIEPLGASGPASLEVSVTDPSGAPVPNASVVALFGADVASGTTDVGGLLTLPLTAPVLMGQSSEWVDADVAVTAAGFRPAHVEVPFEVLPQVPPNDVPLPPPWTEARFRAVATEESGLEGNRTEEWRRSEILGLLVGNLSCDAQLFNVSSDEVRLTINHNSDPVETMVHTDMLETVCPDDGGLLLRRRWQQATITTHESSGNLTNTASLIETHEGWPSLNPVNLSMAGGLTELSTVATEHLLRQRFSDGILVEDTERWQWANDSVTIIGVETLPHWLGQRTVYHLTRSLDGVTTEHWWYDPQLQVPLRRTIQEEDGTVLWEFSLAKLDDAVAPPTGSAGIAAVLQVVGSLPSLYEGGFTSVRLQVRKADAPLVGVADVLLNITVTEGLGISPTPAKTNATGDVHLTLSAQANPGEGPFSLHASVIPGQGYWGNLTQAIDVLEDSLPPLLGAPTVGDALQDVALEVAINATDAQTGVAGVWVYYRPSPGNAPFARSRLGSVDSITYTGLVSAAALQPPAIALYFEAIDGAQTVALLPPGGPSAPQIITVSPTVSVAPQCSLTSGDGHLVRSTVTLLGTSASSTCALVSDDPSDPRATGLRWNVSAISTIVDVAIEVTLSTDALPIDGALSDLRIAQRSTGGSWEELPTTLGAGALVSANAPDGGTFALRWHTPRTLPTPDITAPVLAVRSHAQGARVEVGPVLVFGVVSDDVGVTSLQVRLDGGPWEPLPPLTNWSVLLRLKQGDHHIELRATDAAGNSVTAALNLTATDRSVATSNPIPSPLVLALIGVVSVLAVGVAATYMPRHHAVSKRSSRRRVDDSEE